MDNTFYIEPEQLIINKPITISGVVSGGIFNQNLSNSMYTEKEDAMESIAFGYIEMPRLVNLEKEIRNYEEKYKIKSDDFYKNWKMNPSFDNLDFNEWARLYKFLEYAKKN